MKKRIKRLKERKEKMNKNKFSAYIFTNYEAYEELGKKYGVEPSELVTIDLNRSGIYLPNNEVREDFRVRFKGQILDGYESWYALPVRNAKDTMFSAQGGKIYFDDLEIGKYDELYFIKYTHFH